MVVAGTAVSILFTTGNLVSGVSPVAVSFRPPPPSSSRRSTVNHYLRFQNILALTPPILCRIFKYFRAVLSSPRNPSLSSPWKCSEAIVPEFSYEFHYRTEIASETLNNVSMKTRYPRSKESVRWPTAEKLFSWIFEETLSRSGLFELFRDDRTLRFAGAEIYRPSSRHLQDSCDAKLECSPSGRLAESVKIIICRLKSEPPYNVDRVTRNVLNTFLENWPSRFFVGITFFAMNYFNWGVI